MAENPQKRAMEFIAQADKKLHSPGGLFGSLFGGSDKTEEAAELYKKAGNCFKMAKNWKAAGDVFCKVAALESKAKNMHESAVQYVEAGNCYRKINSADAVKTLQRAIDIYTDMGRFRIAAKHHVTIAEIYEKEEINIPKSVAHYEIAADYYKGEESSCAANKCFLKVAHFAALDELYEKAIAIYETIAVASMDSKLLRYGAKEYYFRAGLCRMCYDVQDASNTVNRYDEMFPTFADSRECKLLRQLTAACVDDDVDAFTSAVRDYDRISRLDPWYTTLLLRIKKGLETEYDLR